MKKSHAPHAIGYTCDLTRHGISHEQQVCGIGRAAKRLGLEGALSIAKEKPLRDVVSDLCRGDVLIVARRLALGEVFVDVCELEQLARKRKARIVSAHGEGTDSDSADSVFVRHMHDAINEYNAGMRKEEEEERAKKKKAMGNSEERFARAWERDLKHNPAVKEALDAGAQEQHLRAVYEQGYWSGYQAGEGDGMRAAHRND